jgi:response regulator RpfG family c-di-GMP phosphodiesterase
LAQTLLLCKVNQVKGKLVQQKPTILIVDRNPNIREYLKRELGCEGYHIQQAENCRILLQMINDNPKLDLIIIDPDLPDVEEKLLLRKLQSMQPRTQVVIHTLIADYLAHCSVRLKTVFVEKDGNSIERLKHVVAPAEFEAPCAGSFSGNRFGCWPAKQKRRYANLGRCWPGGL